MNKNVDFADDAALLQLHGKGPQRLNPIQYWWACHIRAFFFACGEMIRYPLTNLMTLFAIAIAFTLPATLFALLQNAENIATTWHNTPQISLYLKQNITPDQRNQFIKTLQQNKQIANVTYISPADGLKTLQGNTDIDSAVQAIASNPLPGVLAITPNTSSRSPIAIQGLYQSLQSNNLIDSAQLNITWIKRLFYMIDILKHITLAMMVLFSFGLIFIVGNTIRLAMQRYSEEITVLSLIGATKSFIRRPLLYRGVLYGVLGGAIAWLLTACTLWSLEKPASALALTYHNVVTLQGLSIAQGFAIILAGGLLGYIGARLQS